MASSVKEDKSAMASALVCHPVEEQKDEAAPFCLHAISQKSSINGDVSSASSEESVSESSSEQVSLKAESREVCFKVHELVGPEKVDSSHGSQKLNKMVSESAILNSMLPALANFQKKSK